MPKCEKCNTSFPNWIKIDGTYKNLCNRKYCLDCSPYNKHNTKVLKKVNKRKVLCKECGNMLSKSQKVFCDNNCKTNYYYKSYIGRWKQGLEGGMKGKYSISSRIKKYLFEKFDNKCSCCGWQEVNLFTKKIPLEIHHKDGNYMNNREENLELLCPNCHSLTNTYKNSNPNGRAKRSKHAGMAQ